MKAAPPVSVVLAVRDGSAYIATAVESILAQTLTDFELLVVDDGSTDATTAIVDTYVQEDPRVRLLVREPRGLVAALNEGCDVARADYLARMDADDVAAPLRLEMQLAFLREHRQVGVLGSAVTLIDQDDRELGVRCLPKSDAEIREVVGRENPFVHPTVVIRRDAFVAVGGYREIARHAEDYDLWLRMSELVGLANLSEPLLRYRMHPGSVTSSNLRQQTLAKLAVRAAHRSRTISGDDPLLANGTVDFALLRALAVTRECLQAEVERTYIGRARADAAAGAVKSALALVAAARAVLDDAGIDGPRPRLDVAEARFRVAAREYGRGAALLGRSLATAPATVGGMAVRAVRRTARRA